MNFGIEVITTLREKQKQIYYEFSGIKTACELKLLKSINKHFVFYESRGFENVVIIIIHYQMLYLQVLNLNEMILAS